MMAGGAHQTFDAESLLRSLMDNVPGASYRCMMAGTRLRARVPLET